MFVHEAIVGGRAWRRLRPEEQRATCPFGQGRTVRRSVVFARRSSFFVRRSSFGVRRSACEPRTNDEPRTSNGNDEPRTSNVNEERRTANGERPPRTSAAAVRGW